MGGIQETSGSSREKGVDDHANSSQLLYSVFWITFDRPINRDCSVKSLELDSVYKQRIGKGHSNE